MRLDFTKMHGLGNDFIVFDAPQPDAIPTPARIAALADRHTGIGFSQAEILRAYAVQLHLKQVARLLRASRVETGHAVGEPQK